MSKFIDVMLGITAIPVFILAFLGVVVGVVWHSFVLGWCTAYDLVNDPDIIKKWRTK